MENLMLPCLNKLLFGIDCMGCGGQRAVVLLIKGEFAAAFSLYPAIYTLLILFAFFIVNIFFTFRYSKQIKLGLIILNVLIIAISYIIKMSQHFF